MITLEEKPIVKTEAGRWIPPKPIKVFSYQRFIPLLAIVLVYLTYGLFLSLGARTTLDGSIAKKNWIPHLANKPFLDDAFYVLTVSENIAQGRGFSYVEGAPTSGVQPLATLLNAALAVGIHQLGGDSWDLVRALLFLNILAQLIFAGLIALLTWKVARPGWRDELLPILAFFLTLFNFHVFRIFTNGLETGLYLILIISQVLYSLYWMKKFEEKKSLEQKDRICLGLLTGVTILTRIDFMVTLALWFFMLFSLMKGKRIALLKEARLPALISTIMIAPWFVWVHQVTGTWMPSSGSAQMRYSDWSHFFGHSWAMIKALISHLTPWIYTGQRTSLSIIAVLSLVTLWIWFKTQRVQAKGSWIKISRTIQPQIFRYVSLWALPILGLIPVYLVGFSASYFYARYTAPVLIVILPVMAFLLRYEFARMVMPRHKYFQASIVGLFFVWAFLSFHTGRIMNTQVIAADYIRHHYFSEEKIGAWQSGILGFTHSNVYNLDGKLDQKAFQALQSGKMAEFIDQKQINILIDWPAMIEGFLSRDYLSRNWRPCPESLDLEQTLCLERIEPKNR